MFVGHDSNFYGTTTGSGFNNYGTVFELTSAGAESLVHSFTSVSGPPNGLTEAGDGTFYGATSYNDKGSPSTVFQLGVTGSPGSLSFGAATPSVNENASSVSLTVARTGGSGGAGAVNYATANANANTDTDSYPNPYAHAHLDAHPDTHAHAHAAPGRHANSYPNATTGDAYPDAGYPRPNSNDADTHPSTDAHPARYHADQPAGRPFHRGRGGPAAGRQRRRPRYRPGQRAVLPRRHVAGQRFVGALPL